MSRNDKENEAGKCTWLRAVAFLVVCIVAGLLTWLLTPWDEIIGNILPTFENTKTGDDLNDGASPTFGRPTSPGSSPTPPPITASSPFNRCDSNSDSPCCNGLESNCQKRVNEVVFATSHNAMSSREDGFSGYNHLLSLEKSLDKGYRALMLDLCDCGVDGLQLCHSICASGTRDPIVVFENIKDFLSRNPEEVLILVFQIGRDGLGVFPIPVSDLRTLMDAVPDLTDMIYDHPPNLEWPTLERLIEDNKRLIIFHHESSDCSQGECPRGFHPYFQSAVETPFSFKSLEELNDYDRSCKFDRGSDGKLDFYNVNIFINKLLPNENDARIVNAEDFLSKHLSMCALEAKRGPNLVAVDFWSIGALPAVVQEFNSQDRTQFM